MTVTKPSRTLLRPEDLIDEIAVQSYVVSATFRRHGGGLARDVGLTQARMQVMRMALGDGLPVPRIARRLGVSRQNVQRIADALVAEGAAEFTANPDHKSSPKLMLTDKGLRAMDDWALETRAYRQQLAQKLGRKNLVELLDGLRNLAEALNGMPDYEDS